MPVRKFVLWVVAAIIVAAVGVVTLGLQARLAFQKDAGGNKALALMTSGRNPVGYQGRTGTTYTGNLGGIAGANAKCQLSYAGSHMCTQSEALRSGATSFGGQGWIACSLYYTGFQGDIGPTYYWNECSNATTETTFTADLGQAATQANCGQWESALSTDKAPIMNSVGSVSESGCNASQVIHCCR